MKNWHKISFGELVDFPPKISLRSGDSFPFIGMEDLDTNSRYVQNFSIRPYSSSGSAKFQVGDVLMARITPCLENGKIAQVQRLDGEAGFGSTEFFVYRAVKDKIAPGFLFYLAKSDLLWKSAVNSMVGASGRQRADSKFLKKVIVTIPNVATQEKIAAILTAYDDLIEVNKRRIALLEKMAEELYREWFVRMRFPGHQNAKFVKGVPVGWEPVAIETLVKRIPPGKLYDQRTAQPEGTVPILDQGRNGIIGYHNDRPGALATLATPLIVFANHTCYQRLIFYSFSAIQNVLPFIPNDEAIDIYWLYYATKESIQFSEYKGHWPAFMATQIYKPNSDLTKSFGSFAKPILHQIYSIELLNRNITRTRDLLLPRLISGKLSVEDLDIQFPPSMRKENPLQPVSTIAT